MRHQELFEELTGSWDGDSKLAEHVREGLQREARRENERMWALYRLSDRSQEATAREIIDDRDARPDQSQVSRIIRRVDERILAECTTLDPERPENVPEDECHNFIQVSEDKLDALTEPFEEAYKDFLAETILRRHALDAAATPTKEFPDWCEEFLPAELVDQLARLRAEHYESMHWYREDPQAEPTPEVRRELEASRAETAVSD